MTFIDKDCALTAYGMVLDSMYSESDRTGEINQQGQTLLAQNFKEATIEL